MSARQTYYLFTGLIAFGMAATVTAYTPFLEQIGLSLGQIALVNAIFWFALIASELPTGMLADGRSRAWSLRMGVLIYGAGAAVYVFAVGFWTAALAEVLVGIGGAFLSGAQQAWIADALAREGKQDDLRKVYATESMIRGCIMLLGGFVGSGIAMSIGYRFIWVPFIITGLVAAFVSRRYMNGQGEPLEYVTELEAFRLSFRLLRQSRALVWVISAMIVFGAVLAFNHYWALYFIKQVGQSGLAWIWIVVYLGFVVAGWFARRLKTQQGREGQMIAVALALTGIGLLISATHLLGVALFGVVVHEFGRGFFMPLTDSFVQHRVHTSYRATFGSLQSFLGRIGNVIIPLVVWVSIEGKPNTIDTISTVWVVAAVFMLLGAAVLYLLRPNGHD